jgi:hypothetical protein
VSNNFFHGLLANIPADLPGSKYVPLLEDFFHFFKRTTDGFREHEEDMNECREVESTENEVGLPCNGAQAGGYCVSETEVEEPVGGL